MGEKGGPRAPSQESAACMTPPSSPSALVGTTSMMLLPPCHCFSTPATLGGGGGRGKESSREQGGAGGGGRAVLAQEVLVEEDGACGGAAPLSGRARGRLAAEVQGRAPGGKLTVVIHRPPCVHDSRTAPSTRQSPTDGCEPVRKISCAPWRGRPLLSERSCDALMQGSGRVRSPARAQAGGAGDQRSDEWRRAGGRRAASRAPTPAACAANGRILPRTRRRQRGGARLPRARAVVNAERDGDAAGQRLVRRRRLPAGRTYT